MSSNYGRLLLILVAFLYGCASDEVARMEDSLALKGWKKERLSDNAYDSLSDKPIISGSSHTDIKGGNLEASAPAHAKPAAPSQVNNTTSTTTNDITIATTKHNPFASSDQYNPTTSPADKAAMINKKGVNLTSLDGARYTSAKELIKSEDNLDVSSMIDQGTPPQATNKPQATSMHTKTEHKTQKSTKKAEHSAQCYDDIANNIKGKKRNMAMMFQSVKSTAPQSSATSDQSPDNKRQKPTKNDRSSAESGCSLLKSKTNMNNKKSTDHASGVVIKAGPPVAAISKDKIPVVVVADNRSVLELRQKNGQFLAKHNGHHTTQGKVALITPIKRNIGNNSDYKKDKQRDNQQTKSDSRRHLFRGHSRGDDITDGGNYRAYTPTDVRRDQAVVFHIIPVPTKSPSVNKQFKNK